MAAATSTGDDEVTVFTPGNGPLTAPADALGTPALLDDFILVPQAIQEPPDAEQAAPRAEAAAAPSGERRDRGRGRRGGRGREAAEEDAPLAVAVPEPAAVAPALATVEIPVAQALLECVPPDWSDADAVARDFSVEAPGAAEERRRRGRRRGRRGEEEGAEERDHEEAPARVIERAPRERRERESTEFREILVNVDDRETRIAVMEGGRLVELHIEREERVVGGVYKGRVCNVLPGMDAAFVDIGLDRNAFLYVGDILFDDPGKSGTDGPARRTSRDIRITDVARTGQEILVQVVKGPRGTKGARVSTRMSIPGRYLVLMPEGDHQGVSRKIEDARERERLRRLAEEIQPKGFGLIVRTEAEGHTDTEIRQDLAYLMQTWEKICEKARKSPAPAVIHKDLGIVLKTIRDLFGHETDRLTIDSVEEYEKIVETLGELAPDLVDRVVLHEDATPIFARYNLEEEIDRLLRRKVWLRNGAYLLVDTTEALTTIDVNTGKFVGTSSLAETILKTNLDAVDEIARQLRLRDIGGMIVLDFIDMASSRDRQQVMKALESAFRRDRTRIKIAHISPLGLVEMTRKRTSESVTDVMSQVCPYCQGRGRVWSPETMAIQIEREIRKLCATTEVDAIQVTAHPEVAAWLIGAEGENVERLERMLRRPVYIRCQADLHVEQYHLQPGEMLETEQDLLPYRPGDVIDCRVVKSEQIAPPRSLAWANGYMIDLAGGVRLQGQNARVRLVDVRRSFALAEPVTAPGPVDRGKGV